MNSSKTIGVGLAVVALVVVAFFGGQWWSQRGGRPVPPPVEAPAGQPIGATVLPLPAAEPNPAEAAAPTNAAPAAPDDAGGAPDGGDGGSSTPAVPRPAPVTRCQFAFDNLPASALTAAQLDHLRGLGNLVDAARMREVALCVGLQKEGVDFCCQNYENASEACWGARGWFKGPTGGAHTNEWQVQAVCERCEGKGERAGKNPLTGLIRATCEAVRAGSVAKCPSSPEDHAACEAVVSLDPAKCAGSGQFAAPCKEHVERLIALRAELQRLDATPAGATLAAVAQGRSKSCAPILEAARATCKDQ